MKYVLIIFIYSLNAPTLEPLLAHKTFDTELACERAKQISINQKVPKGIIIAGTCVSADALVQYTRT